LRLYPAVLGSDYGLAFGDDSQQKQIDALTAGLQKVSAQLELSRHAPQTVLTDH